MPLFVKVLRWADAKDTSEGFPCNSVVHDFMVSQMVSQGSTCHAPAQTMVLLPAASGGHSEA